MTVRNLRCFHNTFSISQQELDKAPARDFVRHVSERMMRNAEVTSERRLVDELHANLSWTFRIPTMAETFDRIGSETSEFRKLRLGPDDFLGPGPQVVEAPVPDTDDDGNVVAWKASGSCVALASALTVTQGRFDAWMQRLEAGRA